MVRTISKNIIDEKVMLINFCSKAVPTPYSNYTTLKIPTYFPTNNQPAPPSHLQLLITPHTYRAFSPYKSTFSYPTINPPPPTFSWQLTTHLSTPNTPQLDT